MGTTSRTRGHARLSPVKARYRKSYEVRYGYQEPTRQHPPDVIGVERGIDLHCHAHQGQQDPIALVRHASRAGLGGFLFKTLELAFGATPMAKLVEIEDALHRWADAEKAEPVRCWAGLTTDRWMGGPTRAAVEPHLKGGVRAVWMPTASHANSISQVGGRRRWFEPTADARDLLPPMTMKKALALGAPYLLKDGRLDPEVCDVVRLCADYDVALFFGHVTHDEQDALVEEVIRLGFRKAVVDHPFSPFVDLSIARMKEFAEAGLFMNFTYDELSPLLGVDPFEMYQAIRAVGCERVTLSSDAGEPLFPDSVECMRLMRSYMRAFGLSAEEIEQVTVTNPRYLLGVN